MSGGTVERSTAIDATRSVSEWLLEALPTLSAEEWQAPEACGIWSAADVAAHLLWVADMYGDGVRRALVDDIGRPSGLGLPANRTGSWAPLAWQEIWSDWPANRPRIPSIYRQELGERVPDALADWSQALVALFESMASTDWDRPTFHPAGIRTIRQMCSQFVLEMGVHGWDIVHRSRRAVTLPAQSHAPMVEIIPWYVQRSFVPRERLATPERYRFDLGHTVSSRMRLNVFGDSWDLGPETGDEVVDAVLTTDPQTYVLLFMGRRRWREVTEDGSLRITGPQHVVTMVPALFGLT